MKFGLVTEHACSLSGVLLYYLSVSGHFFFGDHARKVNYSSVKLFSFCQLTEDTLSGPPGLSVMSRVVMELNCAVAPAPIRRPRTMEHRAKNILKNHGYVLLRTAQVNFSNKIFIIKKLQSNLL